MIKRITRVEIVELVALASKVATEGVFREHSHLNLAERIAIAGPIAAAIVQVTLTKLESDGMSSVYHALKGEEKTI